LSGRREYFVELAERTVGLRLRVFPFQVFNEPHGILASIP
jgi:hypothetical protein